MTVRHFDRRQLILKKKELPMRISNSIAELRQQIHDDLRTQHPDWVETNGESPTCDSNEACLMDQLLTATPFVDFQKRVNDKFRR
jgi:hypothetical protein